MLAEVRSTAQQAYEPGMPDAGDSEAVLLDEVGVELGQLYRNLANDASLPEAARPDEWKGQPGTRAPHVWLDDSIEREKRVSTLEWFGRGWVLVTAGGHWVADAGIYVVRGAESVRQAFGLPPEGASLVRPDGVIAWRKAEPEGIVSFRS